MKAILATVFAALMFVACTKKEEAAPTAAPVEAPAPVTEAAPAAPAPAPEAAAPQTAPAPAGK